jgi:hypothetical protein
MGLLEEVLGHLAAHEGQGDVAKLIGDIGAIWQGSEVSMTPVLTTPSGSHWLPALGIEISSDLREVKPCSVAAIRAQVQKSRGHRTSL